jgi:hypothetical protein
MRTVLSLAVLAALIAPAQAQDSKTDSKTDSKIDKTSPAPKGIESKSPWSVDSVTKSDGYFGSSSTTVTRDIGDGWSVGGKMTTPYQDEKIGGGGAPGLKQYESPGNSTVFGPVLEKKF